MNSRTSLICTVCDSHSFGLKSTIYETETGFILKEFEGVVFQNRISWITLCTQGRPDEVSLISQSHFSHRFHFYSRLCTGYFFTRYEKRSSLLPRLLTSNPI